MTTHQAAIDFAATVTSITVSRLPSGLMVTSLNVEGQAGSYGPFAGTMTVTGAGKGGSWHYDGFGMPADGSNLSGSWNGSYEFAGPMRWRASAVGVFQSDTEIHNSRMHGEVNLEKRAWTGQIEIM